MTPAWLRLLPDADFRLPMALRPGDAGRFWRDWDAGGGLARERARWLANDPPAYRVTGPGAEFVEAEAWMRSHSAAPEPDWVLLDDSGGGEPVVTGGEVVFPSSWSLPDKLGKPLSGVHAPVPGLQTALGTAIQRFLSKLEPGAAWERENWGLSANEELNHHPALARPRPGPDAALRNTWLRLESQFLTRLPKSRCILFGIRVTAHRLDELAALPGVAARLARALATMPDTVAHYKGLREARLVLLRELERI
jgi:hypothetical protein